MSTETPVSYWAANMMYIRDVQTKIGEKAVIKSDVFFCRQDPQQVNFRFGIDFGDRECAFVEATRNVPKARISICLSDDGWKTTATFTVYPGPPSKLASLKKETPGYIYIGHSFFGHSFFEPSTASSSWNSWNWRLSCEVEYEASLPINLPNRRSLHGDLLNLLESSENADVTFSVKGEKIKAHKTILAARSDYFKRMFDSSMKESVSDEVDIQDSELDVITSMLQYLYSGLPPKNLDVIAVDLLAVSDKYGLEELKRICESNICSNLTAKTVVDALILADRHGCEDLMTRAKTVFKTNIGAVKRSTEDWEKLRSHHHVNLLLKLLEIYVIEDSEEDSDE